jgi:hypothetical protein
MEPILGGSHLIFPPEEMDSDGSDYTQSSAEEDDESINSGNCDMEIDTFPMSRILRKCNIVFDPPKQPSWKEMSLETLKGLIQQHRETGTVRRFLCAIDPDSNYYDGCYFEIEREEDIPSTQGLAENEKVQVRRYLSYKKYYTMLCFACADPDGKRGESKIKLILQTAKRLQVNMRTFVATSSFRRSSPHTSWQECSGAAPMMMTLSVLKLSRVFFSKQQRKLRKVLRD